MMPPTGLTLFIHASVIVIKKISNLFGRPFCEDTYKEETTARQAISSFAIMSLVFVYVMVVITGFVSTAIHDERATWRVIYHLIRTTEISPPQYHKSPDYYFLAEHSSPPILLSLNQSFAPTP